MFLLHAIYQRIYRYKIFLIRKFSELKITKMWIKVKIISQQVIDYTISGANHKNNEWKSCEHILKSWFWEADNLYHFLEWRKKLQKYLNFLVIEFWVSICFLITYGIKRNIYCSVPLVKPFWLWNWHKIGNFCFRMDFLFLKLTSFGAICN